MIKAYILFGGIFMSKRITVINIIVTSLLGTLLHFAYDFFGQNYVIGLFSAVNESIWEHQKLLFFPTFFVSIIQFVFCRDCRKCFWISRLFGVLFGMLIIISLYYTVTGIIGKNIDAFNIALFYIGVISTFVLSNIFQKNRVLCGRYSNIIGFSIFIALSILFVLFTNNPPSIALFQDPQAIKNATGN